MAKKEKSKQEVDLDRLLSEKDQYDPQSREIIDGLAFARNELHMLESMKRTEGWKVLDKKVREELHLRIHELIKDDIKVQTLIKLLKVADTKSQTKILENEIEKLLPG